MSDQTNNTNSHNHDDDKKTEVSSEQTLRKPRGIGFLGRRGTAPINTTASEHEKKDSEEQESENNSKAQDKGASSSNDKQDNKEGSQKAQAAPIALGPSDKVFSSLSNYPILAWLFIVFLWALQSISSIWLPSTFLAQELHLAEVYADMIGMGQWLIPPATEHIKASFPAYYWFMALVDVIPLRESIFFPLIASITALLVISSVYVLALCAGLGKRVAFASALLMLVSPSFIGLSHMLNVEFFASGLFAFALALLCKAWTSETAPLKFILGFLLLCLASLSIGFVVTWTVLISSIIFIFWRGTFGRANKFDAVLGFGVLVIVFAAWLVIIIIGGGSQASALDQLMQGIVAPFMPPYWPLKPEWFCGLALLAIGIVPWICLPLCSPWVKILKNSLASLKGARKENSGVAWLYICLVVGCILLVRSAEHYSAILFYPIITILLAKALCNLSNLGSNIFFALLSGFAILLGIVCIGLSFDATAALLFDFMPKQAVYVLTNIIGLDMVGGVLLLMALVLLRFTTRTAPCGSLLVVAIFVLLLIQPFTMFVAPSIVGKGVDYHPYGMGLGVLPFGLGAEQPVPSPAIVSPLDESAKADPVPSEAAPAHDADNSPSFMPNANTPSIAPDVQAPNQAPNQSPAPSMEPEQSLEPNVESSVDPAPDSLLAPPQNQDLKQPAEQPAEELPAANATGSLSMIHTYIV